jgi:hypothetical protein
MTSALDTSSASLATYVTSKSVVGRNEGQSQDSDPVIAFHVPARKSSTPFAEAARVPSRFGTDLAEARRNDRCAASREPRMIAGDGSRFHAPWSDRNAAEFEDRFQTDPRAAHEPALTIEISLTG